MIKEDLKVGDFVILKNMPWIVGETHYGAWKNESIGVDHTQYGSYILFYDEGWYRVGFDNMDFNYIERTCKSFPTYPMS